MCGNLQHKQQVKVLRERQDPPSYTVQRLVLVIRAACGCPGRGRELILDSYTLQAAIHVSELDPKLMQLLWLEFALDEVDPWLFEFSLSSNVCPSDLQHSSSP